MKKKILHALAKAAGVVYGRRMDVASAAGVVVACSGIWQIHPPSALIAGGVAIVISAEVHS